MSATQSERVTPEQLTRTPYIQVISYPRPSLRTARSRISQLRKMGIDEVVFEGRPKIGRLGILGLGTVGVVVKGIAGDRVVALKVRRTDANRESMAEEARVTALVNKVGVGPPLYGHTKDILMMKFLDYLELHEWVRELRGPGRRQAAREMVHGALNQCRMLDIMGVDHGQLSNLRKHLVVAEGMPWIMDFESASTARRPKNVTTAAQYLFIGGRVSPLLRRVLGIRKTGPVLELLTRYKADTSDYTYSKLLEQLALAPRVVRA